MYARTGLEAEKEVEGLFIEVRRALEEGHGKTNAYLEFHVIYGQKLLSAQESLKRKRTTVYVRIDPDSV